MNNTFDTAIRSAAPPAQLTLTGIIVGAVQAAAAAGRQLKPSGHLGHYAACVLRNGGRLDERQLIEAAKTELTLRYGARIGVNDLRLRVLGATHHAIALLFDGQRIALQPGDPVDIIAPWGGPLPTPPLQAIVQDMLDLSDAVVNTRIPRIIERLTTYAAGLESWPWPDWPDGDTYLLFGQVVAANIELLHAYHDSVQTAARQRDVDIWRGAQWIGA